MAARKKKTKKKAAKKQSARKKDEVLLVASKVKQAIKAAGCNTSGDAVDGLNDWVGFLIRQATARAKANGRKTVRRHDFIS